MHHYSCHAACPSGYPAILLGVQADLNGDGKPEIITANPTGKLQILAPRHFGDGFAKAEVSGGRIGLCIHSRRRRSVVHSNDVCAWSSAFPCLPCCSCCPRWSWR